MKKILSLIISLFCFVAIICNAQDNGDVKTEVNVEAQKLNVIFDGQNYDGMNLYDISGSSFLSLRELAVFYNARLEWFSVSKKVSMKLKNKSIDIFYDSKKVSFGKKKEKLSIPSIMLKKEVFVPIELLSLKGFSEISETVSDIDLKHKILNVTTKSNISAVRYYTKENDTEIVIELEEKMTHTVKKGKNSIIVAFQRGRIAKDSVVANNGAIKDISYETVGREAVFTINLAQTPKLVRTKKYKKPLKLVIDIEHTKAVNMTKPCEIYLPETVVETADRQAAEMKEEQEIKERKEALQDKKVVEENSSEKEDKTSEIKLSENEKKEDLSPIEPPVIDTRIIANDSQIYDTHVLEKDYEDTEGDIPDLSKIKVVNVQEDQIIDDTYALIDDTSTFKDIIPKKKEIAKDAKIIVLDAGHGGQDPGAIGPHGIKEKDVNLAIVLYLEKIFKKDKNYKVILTRDDDTFIPLVERANVANKNKADLFISVHCNANLKRSASGFEIYFLSENASDSAAISTETLENSVIALEDKSDEKKTVLQNMLWSMVVNEYINESSELSSFIVCEASGRLKIPNNGIKQANFYVLRGTQMPSVLVECAYLSNYTEEAKLQTGSFQKSVADAIYEGVKKYYARKNTK
jgi:N-acetylmuramoyl-L-alanine amidase